jgi:hypothetical protein
MCELGKGLLMHPSDFGGAPHYFLSAPATANRACRVVELWEQVEWTQILVACGVYSILRRWMLSLSNLDRHHYAAVVDGTMSIVIGITT